MCMVIKKHHRHFSDGLCGLIDGLKRLCEIRAEVNLFASVIDKPKYQEDGNLQGAVNGAIEQQRNVKLYVNIYVLHIFVSFFFRTDLERSAFLTDLKKWWWFSIHGNNFINFPLMY